MIPSNNVPPDPKVKAFFDTHNSTKVYNLPDITAEQLTELSSLIPSILTQSPVLTRIFSMVGLQAHRDSLTTLLSCVYHAKCPLCNTSPVVVQALVIHPRGVITFLEDTTTYSHPPEHQSWPVPEGFHFLLQYRCPQCKSTLNSIATYLPEVGRLIHSHAMGAAEFKNLSDEEVGFIVQPSWITTYFEKKAFDKVFAQQTVLACLQCYRDLKRARQIRQLPEKTFQEELAEGTLDVLRNLIPQLSTEEEFCGLIKGAYLFILMHMGDSLYQFVNLDPSTTPFSFSQLQQEFRSVADNLSYEEKKGCLASAILAVDKAYRVITPSVIILPEWVATYRKV